MDDSMSRRNVLTGAAALAIPAIEGTAMAKTSAHSILGRSDGRWLNEPKSWSVDEHGELSVATDEGTDFWRSTHYGFIRDSGHFLGFTAPGAFTAQLRIRGNFEKLYDQAGIMVRVDEQRWVKAGIELSDGRAMLSSVLPANPTGRLAPMNLTHGIFGCAQPSPKVFCAFRSLPTEKPGHSSASRHSPSRQAIWSDQ